MERLTRDDLLRRYRETRNLSVDLCRPLHAEDYRIQSMPDVSPPWWNLGHTTWFFAKNILEPFGLYSPEDARLEFVMNSYYESLGPRISRDHRGLVTRPTNEDVFQFRRSVDARVEELLSNASEEELERLRFLVYTGIQHEQQHQELLVTELKHILGSNVPELREAYRSSPATNSHGAPPAARWIDFDGGLQEAGNVEGGWCWDNEMPVHKAWLDGFSLMSRPVTNAEYLEFMADGGYRNPLLWMSNGWAKVKEQGWTAPFYWEGKGGEQDGERWQAWTLAGVRDVDPGEPVCHISFYEADAYARWKGARLPTEREWEHAARVSGFPGGNYLDSGVLHPVPMEMNGSGMAQMGGDVWEWTSNHYEPYPGYRPFEGTLMEYNGKFMDNVRVLRGGSCATPANHIRASYRNFWAADTRFQFTGLRLAKDA